MTRPNTSEVPVVFDPEAATEILGGLRAGDFEIHFPKAFTRKLKFLRLLPYRLYFSLIRKATGL